LKLRFPFSLGAPPFSAAAGGAAATSAAASVVGVGVGSTSAIVVIVVVVVSTSTVLRMQRTTQERKIIGRGGARSHMLQSDCSTHFTQENATAIFVDVTMALFADRPLIIFLLQ
jgi:hypothetical protein